MQRVAAQVASVPFIQYISRRTQIAPEYVALVGASLAFIAIQKTPLGGFVSNAVAALVLMREVLLTLQSSIPKPSDLRKHVIVLSLFLVFVLLEGLGAAGAVPLFGILKLGAIVWAGASPANAERVYEMLFARVPLEYLQSGDTIEQAVKVAAKTVNEKIESSKDK